MIVFFDLDGTLINSKPEIVATLHQALKICKVNENDQEREFVIGPHLKDLIPMAFPKDYFSSDLLQAVIKTYRDLYEASNHEMTKPFPGIDHLIKSMTFPAYLLTNKPYKPAFKIISSYGWDHYLKDIWASDSSTGESKTSMLRKAKMTFPNETIIMIGDTYEDVHAATENELYSIGVTYGQGSKEELLKGGAKAIVSSGEELEKLLVSLHQKNF